MVVVVGGTVVVVVGGTVVVVGRTVVVVGRTVVVGWTVVVDLEAELLAEPFPEQPAEITATAARAAAPPTRANRDPAGRRAQFRNSCTGDV